jgi:hypothetical protein
LNFYRQVPTSKALPRTTPWRFVIQIDGDMKRIRLTRTVEGFKESHLLGEITSKAISKAADWTVLPDLSPVQRHIAGRWKETMEACGWFTYDANEQERRQYSQEIHEMIERVVLEIEEEARCQG